MNGRVARDLRRLARARYTAIPDDLRPAYTYRAIYQATKKEYKDEKR